MLVIFDNNAINMKFSQITFGQPREVKNSTIMLKFGTLVDWMNTFLRIILLRQTCGGLKLSQVRLVRYYLATGRGTGTGK